MTISTLINSLAWGSAAQPRLRTSLIKDQYGIAVYFDSTKRDMELFSVLPAAIIRRITGYEQKEILSYHLEIKRAGTRWKTSWNWWHNSLWIWSDSEQLCKVPFLQGHSGSCAPLVAGIQLYLRAFKVALKKKKITVICLDYVWQHRDPAGLRLSLFRM